MDVLKAFGRLFPIAAFIDLEIRGMEGVSVGKIRLFFLRFLRFEEGRS